MRNLTELSYLNKYDIYGLVVRREEEVYEHYYRGESYPTLPLSSNSRRDDTDWRDRPCSGRTARSYATVKNGGVEARLSAWRDLGHVVRSEFRGRRCFPASDSPDSPVRHLQTTHGRGQSENCNEHTGCEQPPPDVERYPFDQQPEYRGSEQPTGIERGLAPWVVTPIRSSGTNPPDTPRKRR